MALHEDTIREQLRADVMAAWTDVRMVFDGGPRVWPRPDELPWAAIASEGVTKEYGGAGLLWEWQHYRYQLYGVWSADGVADPAAFRAGKADDLVERVRSYGLPYAGVAAQMRIGQVGPGPDLEPEEPLIAVNIGLHVSVVEEV